MTRAAASSAMSLCLLVGAVGPSVVFTDHAAAQQSIRVAIGGPSAGPGGAVSKKSLERYADLLGLTEDQKAAAVTIHEGYTAAFDQARQTQRDAMNEVRRTAEDSGDHSVWMEKMPGIQSAYRDATTKLEKDLFRDLKDMLSPEQESRWSGVERMRRREVELRSSTLAGEGVDLVEVVNGLKLPADAMKPIRPAIEEYELELDRALAEKQKLNEENAKLRTPGPGRPLDIDQEDMQKAMAKSKEVAQKVQQINERHARKIEGLLPDESRPAFAAEVRNQTFPRVYRASGVSRELDAAFKFDDLTSEQRDQLTLIRDQYTREAAAANERWAAAIREAEATAQEGAVATPQGIMRLSMGDEPAPLVDARKARRELDERMSERLKAALSAAQRARLPKGPPPGESGDAAGVAGMMIVESQVDRR